MFCRPCALPAVCPVGGAQDCEGYLAPGRHELTCTYTTDHAPPRIDTVKLGITLV